MLCVIPAPQMKNNTRVIVTQRPSDLDYFTGSVCHKKDVFVFAKNSGALCNDALLINAYQLCNAAQPECSKKEPGELKQEQIWLLHNAGLPSTSLRLALFLTL